MGSTNFSHVHVSQTGSLNTNQIQDQLAEQDRIIDSHLVRITRLQMLLHLEEARLIRSQQEQRELRSILGVFSMDAVESH